ncbi:MAG: GTP cyclohydrolase I FolE [Blastocatellia bacterium]
MDLDKIAAGVRLILEGIGEDTDRPGIVDTPRRVAEMYEEICGGLHENAAEEIKVIPADSADDPVMVHDEIVMVKDIYIASICEHHLVPFTGVAHIAYIPKDGRIVGLSKLARIAETFARRPQVQERLTTQIAELLYQGDLKPKGVMVVIEAVHLCMTMRGVRKPGTTTITSAVRGVFRRDERTRIEAMSFLTENRRF